MVFDVAGNLITIGAGSGRLRVFAFPKAVNEFTTPCPPSQTFTVQDDPEGPMAGDYYVPNDPGDGKRWFSTLKEACDAINAESIGGNVRLWVNGDITSPDNVGLVNNTDYSIAIASDGGARQTITFTDENPFFNQVVTSDIAASLLGPNGSFIIGCKPDFGWDDVAPAKNVTIENLAIITSPDSKWNVPVVIFDKCDNITIRNCFIKHQSAEGQPRYALHISGISATGTYTNLNPRMPNNVTIEGNEIINTAYDIANAIGVIPVYNSESHSSVVSAENLVIRNNILRGSLRGACVQQANGITFEGNEIYVTNAPNRADGAGFYASTHSGITGNMNITGNKFIELATERTDGGSTGVKGIYVSSSAANYHIVNNYFTGFERKNATGTAMLQAIHTGNSATGTYYIRHNTFYLNKLTNGMTDLPVTPGGSDPSYAAINLTSASATSHIQNNLFVGDEDAFPNFFIRGNAPAASDNNVYCLQGGSVNAKIASGTIPSGLKTAASVSFANAAAGNLDIGSSSEKDPNLEVPRLTGVTNDIYGTVRGTITTYAGAHEAAPFEIINYTSTVIIANPGENSGTEMRISWHMSEGVTGGYVEYTKKSDAAWTNKETVAGTYTLSTTWENVPANTGSGTFTQTIRVNKYGAVLSGLEPDTEYMYRVGLNTLSDTRYFKTAGAKEYNFGWISDSHVHDPLPARLTNVMNMVTRLVTVSGSGGLNFILSTGDLVAYGGSYSYWQNLFSHSHLKNYMLVNMVGNHDIYDQRVNSTYYKQAFFTDMHNNPRNGFVGRQQGCTYWFKYGDVLWIVLNTEITHNATTEAWFEQVIQNNPSKYIFVAQHYQWFNDTGSAGSSGFTRWNQLFDKHGVDVAFSGNSHVYTRSHSLYNGQVNTNPTRGTVYIVAPSSDNDRGRDMPTLNDPNGRISYRWTEGSRTIGGMLVNVGEEKVKVTLYDRNGVQRDYAEIPAKRGLNVGINNTPASDNIRIDCLGNQITITSDSQIQSVKLYDLQGRTIDFKQRVADTICRLNAPSQGIYIIETVTENGRNVQKAAVRK